MSSIGQATYAQNCEDLILSILLPAKKGFYVDIGANLPDRDSVTKLFYDKGWRGINVEPIPYLYKMLVKSRPKDININCGIAKTKGKLMLREYENENHGLSTFSKKLMASTNNGRQELRYKQYKVNVLPLKQILKEHGIKKIDFLKVDTEGYEDEVIESNDWTKWHPSVVVIENTPGRWAERLPQLGYIEVFFDGLNRYFAIPEIHSKLIIPMHDIYRLINDTLVDEVNRLDKKINSILSEPYNYLRFNDLTKALVTQSKRRFRSVQEKQ